jgi:hypothetical protein
VIGVCVALSFLLYLPFRLAGWKRNACNWLAFFCCGLPTFVFGGPFIVAFSVAISAVTETGVGGAASGSVAVAFGGTYVAAGGVVSGVGMRALWVLVIPFAVAGAVARASSMATNRRLDGVFLLVFFSAAIVGCFMAVGLLSSPPKAWELSGPLLLFLVLLTLVNAPFDWASLGLTRALLRRGLELGRCGPTHWHCWMRVLPL